MTTGTQIALGVFIGVVLFAAWRWLHREPRQPARRLSDEVAARVRALHAAGETDQALTELLHRTGMERRDARQYVAALASGDNAGDRENAVSQETLSRMLDLLADGKALLAIKAVRDETGWDLRRSKKFVDRYR